MLLEQTTEGKDVKTYGGTERQGPTLWLGLASKEDCHIVYNVHVVDITVIFVCGAFTAILGMCGSLWLDYVFNGPKYCTHVQLG